VKVNQLEQHARRNNIVISGVVESYAERTDVAVPGEASATPPQPSRDDTIRTVCQVIHEACNITVSPADLSSAHRLQSKRPGPRPILVSFNNSSLRTSVTKARLPRQQLKFRGASIYFNDHLTKLNSDLSHKARQLVKAREAHSTWVREGQVLVKWSAEARPSLVHRFEDFD
jgi:hypothetical protein